MCFKKLWDFSKLMSGDYRWWIILMILFFVSIFSQKPMQNKNRPLAGFPEQLLQKSKLKKLCLTILPMPAGRQAISSSPYSSPVTFHWGGGGGGVATEKGGVYLRSEHQAGYSLSMRPNHLLCQSGCPNKFCRSDAMNNPQKDISVGTVTTVIIHKKLFL